MVKNRVSPVCPTIVGSSEMLKNRTFSVACSVVCSGLLGGLILSPRIASAETLNSSILLAQAVTDGLPPAPPGAEPPIVTPSVTPSAAPAPEFDLRPPTVLPSLPARSPSPTLAPAAPAVIPQATPQAMPQATPKPSQRYLVLVNGDSATLLTRVRTVESDAFIREYDGKRMIQVGLFNDSSHARQQVTALRREGIRAKIENVSGVAATNPQLNTGGTAEPTVVADNSDFSNDATPYYVVIPGNSEILPEIANQVIRLSEGYAIAAVVEEAERPLGNHVRVGPFSGRRSANRWSGYFRDFGMDARVHYMR
jgi:hypothetical protein